MFLNKLLTMKNWGYWHHLKVFVLDMPFLKLVNMPLLMKGKFKFATCEHQIYIIFNSNLYNMAKKTRKKKGRTEKNLFGSKFAITKTIHTNENKVCIQSGNVPTSP
jgi:hypothetical protein